VKTDSNIVLHDRDPIVDSPLGMSADLEIGRDSISPGCRNCRAAGVRLWVKAPAWRRATGDC
jgi:hypothetical protein